MCRNHPLSLQKSTPQYVTKFHPLILSITATWVLKMSVTSPSTWDVIHQMIRVHHCISVLGSKLFICSEIILYSVYKYFFFQYVFFFFFSKLNHVLSIEVEPQLQQSNNMQQQKVLLIRM